MNDYQIRVPLLAGPLGPWVRDPASRVVEEAGMAGRAVDVLVVSTVLHGYEIKSDDDTLTRLAEQAAAFGKACQFMTLVTTAKHLTKAAAIAPSWWGLLVAEGEPGAVTFREERRAYANPGHDHMAVIDLLWGDELRAILRAVGHGKGVHSQNVSRLISRCQQVLGRDEAMTRAIAAFKARKTWGSKKRPEDSVRGGVLQAVVERGQSRWATPAEQKDFGHGRVFDEKLACGHTVVTPHDYNFNMPRRRRCPGCRA